LLYKVYTLKHPNRDIPVVPINMLAGSVAELYSVDPQYFRRVGKFVQNVAKKSQFYIPVTKIENKFKFQNEVYAVNSNKMSF
jgi:hypothetical protein